MSQSQQVVVEVEEVFEQEWQDLELAMQAAERGRCGSAEQLQRVAGCVTACTSSCAGVAEEASSSQIDTTTVTTDAHAEPSSQQHALPASRGAPPCPAAVSVQPAEPSHQAPCRRQTQAPLLEVEEMGRTFNRKVAFRPRGLHVTDLTAADWCQQQVAFKLTMSWPQEALETAAMRAGSEHHGQLEAEVSLKVEVAVETAEDAWAVRLLNILLCLRQLRMEGLTREMFIFGQLEGRWVRGVIDAMELDERGHACVVEVKTRRRPCLPHLPQQRQAALQVQIYRALLEGLCGAGQVMPLLRDLLAFLKLDPELHLAPEVAAQLMAAGLGPTCASLQELCVYFCEEVTQVPKRSDVLRVDYVWQGDGETLGSKEVTFDHDAIRPVLMQHLKFWEGAEPPAVVPAMELWKCRTCAFSHQCSRAADAAL